MKPICITIINHFYIALKVAKSAAKIEGAINFELIMYMMFIDANIKMKFFF